MSTSNINNTYFLKSQMRLLKTKTGISIMKNTLKGINSEFNVAEGRISKIRTYSNINTQNETETKKIQKRNRAYVSCRTTSSSLRYVKLEFPDEVKEKGK